MIQGKNMFAFLFNPKSLDRSRSGALSQAIVRSYLMGDTEWLTAGPRELVSVTTLLLKCLVDWKLNQGKTPKQVFCDLSLPLAPTLLLNEYTYEAYRFAQLRDDDGALGESTKSDGLIWRVPTRLLPLTHAGSSGHPVSSLYTIFSRLAFIQRSNAFIR